MNLSNRENSRARSERSDRSGNSDNSAGFNLQNMKISKTEKSIPVVRPKTGDGRKGPSPNRAYGMYPQGMPPAGFGPPPMMMPGMHP